jgi:4-hydroxy-3-methylbut-2-enyl diphosphate reductase
MGEAPGSIVLVESVEDAMRVVVRDPRRVAYVTQTTLSVDDTAEILRALRERFPAIEGPRRDDICYATTNRQLAVKELAAEIDVLLVIGSRNSSNSNRLVEVARAAGVEAHLIEDETEIEDAWLARAQTVGLTSGASAPEDVVHRVCAWFAARGVSDVRAMPRVVENVVFRLPAELRRPLSAA